MDELLEIQSELIHKAFVNYYKIETLRGYCESIEDEKVSPVMLETLLEEICSNQKNIIHDIDSEITHFAHKYYSKSCQKTD